LLTSFSEGLFELNCVGCLACGIFGEALEGAIPGKMADRATLEAVAIAFSLEVWLFLLLLCNLELLSHHLFHDSMQVQHGWVELLRWFVDRGWVIVRLGWLVRRARLALGWHRTLLLYILRCPLAICVSSLAVFVVR